MTDRIDRLREHLEEPLLVTDPTTSATSLRLRELELRAPRRAGPRAPLHRLPLHRGRARSRGVEPVQTKRNLIAELADMLSGRVASRRVLAYGLYEVLRDGGLDLCRRAAPSRSCAR